MNEYLKNLADGFGTMSPTANKKNEKQPDYQGWVKIEGKFYEIAGWVKFSKTNNKYLSLSIKQKNPDQNEKEI